MTQGYKMSTATYSGVTRTTHVDIERDARDVRQTAVMDFDYRSSLLRRLRAVHSLYVEACATMDARAGESRRRTRGVADRVLARPPGADRRRQRRVRRGPHPPDERDVGDAHGTGDQRPRQGEERRRDDAPAHRRLRRVPRIPTTGLFARLSNSSPRSIPRHSPTCIVALPYGATLAQTFSARVAGEAGITRSDAIECWIYQHALRHMGEIEHARALVGLSGMTS